MSRPAVTNAVLFERISNIAMSVDKMDTRLTQNFESLSHLLQDAYVKKEDLMALEKRIAKIEDFSLPQQRLEYTTEIRQRVHKDWVKPILWIMGAMGTPIAVGAVWIGAQMVLAFLKNL